MTEPTSCRIPLRGLGSTIRGYVIVDKEDLEQLARHRWHMVTSRTNVYARRWERLPDGSEQYVWMHREIMSVGNYDGTIEIDHRDGDGLNNQRSNLIISDRQRNGQTQRKIALASSQHRGVCWAKTTQKWQAQVRVGGKRIYLGQFATEDEAAEAALAGRQKHLPHSRN